MGKMPPLTISQVARQVGLQPSAIRYYERIGILPKAQRVSGQRRFDTTVLYRLAVIRRASQLGFTLDEIRKLFFGFRNDAPPSKRWQVLSAQKLRELDELMEGIQAVRSLLQRQACHCRSLDECGKALLQKQRGDGVQPLPPNRRLKSSKNALVARGGSRSNAD
jgi:MerR family redox-sensitive transcriptional activator SoxR